MSTLSTTHHSADLCVGRAVLFGKQNGKGQELTDLDGAMESLLGLYRRLAETDPIFEAHLEIAGDPMLRDSIEAGMAEGLSLHDATEKAGAEIAAMFDGIDDEYLRARKDDTQDVVTNLLRIISGEAVGAGANEFNRQPADAEANSENETGRQSATENSKVADGQAAAETGTANLKPILISGNFYPSDLAGMDSDRVEGLISEGGSATSHVCILAKSKGIPILTGVKGCMEQIQDGDMVIIDGSKGQVIVNPDALTLQDTLVRISRQVRLSPLEIWSGMTVYANAGSVEDVKNAIEGGAMGIGLFRSEFIYMSDTTALPSEDKQFEIYKEAALICGDKPLTIRTLDIGGDKPHPLIVDAGESNPFLGWRAIRICLDRPEIFKPQLRAILRASAFGNVRIMFPMICTLDELQQAKRILEECKHELEAENVAFNRDIPVGMMVETPAAALKADEFASHVAFFSIGTNDLTQYVMAADRGNSQVSRLYDCRDNAVSACIRMIAQAADKAGIETEVCGEMASDPANKQHLQSLGIREVSVVWA